MPKKSLRKKLGRVTVFSKVGLAMAGSILLQSAPASAGNPDFPGGRGAAFRDFKQANDGLSGKQLNQLFKVHWADMRNSAQAVAQPVFEQNANNLSHGPNVVNTNLNNLQNLSNLPNQVGATKQELNQQFKLERQAQKLEHQALKQELREAKQNINTVQQISADRFIRGNGGFSLDLSSAVENITLGDKLFQNESSITISIGGESKTLSAGSKVTAAEYIAAKQVLATGGQKVGLDSNGRAVSGSIDLNELTPGDKTMKVRDFVVPENVSAAGDFSKNGDIRITGDLINSGTIQAFSSDNKITTATISADNITNNSNASITSDLNQSARDLGGVVSNLGLNLRADDVLSNYGSITSSGDLTLSAGKTLNNSGSAIAQNNLNLQAPKIVNSGRVESIAANVNLDSSTLSSLNVNNFGGTITALDGAINIRSSEYQERFDTLVSGGDLLSKELNVYTGGGTADVFVNALTGIVNTSGTAAHVSANTEELILGTQCLVGDPTYYNTGNIVLGGDIFVNETLAIIAGGSITTNQSDLQINSGGHDISIIAGANVHTGSGEIGPGALPSQIGTPNHNANSPVSFTGQSVSGGNIDLRVAGGRLDIVSGGGDVLLAAYGGEVRTDLGAIISASGSGSSNNGNITVIGSTGVTIGNLNTYAGTGTSAGTGNVSVYAAQPTFSSGGSITFGTNGSITSGNRIVASDTITPTGAVEICNARYTGDLTVKAGGDVIMPIFHIPSSRSNISVSSLNGDIYTHGGSLARSYLLTAGGNIWIRNSFIAPGGIVMIAGRDIASYASGFPKFDASNASGNGGNITLIAGANYSPGSIQNIVGKSATGGSIRLNEVVNMIEKFDNHGGGVNASGGEINLIAYGGVVNVYPTANAILTNGTGSGSSGKVTIISEGLNLRGVDQSGTANGAVRIYNMTLLSSISLTTNSSTSSFGSASFTPFGTFSSANVSAGRMTGVQNLQILTGGNLRLTGINSDGLSGAAINISMNSAQAFTVGGGVSSNGVETTISANAGAVGNGASLSITNLGTGGIVLTTPPSMSVTDGNGITLRLNAGSGLLNVASLGSIDASGVGTNKAAGTIELIGGSLIRTSGNLSLTANSTGSGAGGKIFLRNDGADDILLGTGAGQIAVSASGSGSVIDFETSGSISVLSTNPLSAASISLKAGTGDLLLDSSITANDLTITAPGMVSLLQSISTNGDVTINCSGLTLNAISVTASNIFVSSPFNSSFTLDGGAGSTLTAAVGGQVRVFADSGDLTLLGNTTYTRNAILQASGLDQSIVAAAGSSSIALSSSYLLTNSLSGSGSFVTIGSTWTLANGGMYANSNADVVVSGHLSFAGADFAIISGRSINLTGAIIDLSGDVNGGSLTLLAGYDFTPSTVGTVFDRTTTYTQFIPNATGGSIVGGASISTTGGTGSGGNVYACANKGSITLGSIDTTGAITGGKVVIIANNGIDLSSGTITSTGGTASGNVTLGVASASFPVSSTIQNGVFSAIPTISTFTAGNLKVGSIVAGQGTVQLIGGNSISNSISAIGTITGSMLDVTLSSGVATLSTSVSNISASGIGSLTITNNADVSTATFSGSLTASIDNGTSAFSSVSGSLQALTIKSSELSCSNLSVVGPVNITTVGTGTVSGVLNISSNAELTIVASNNVGVDSNNRFSTNARNIGITAGGSVFLSSTNSQDVSFRTTSVASTFDLLSSKSVSTSGSLSANDIVINVIDGGVGTSESPFQIANGGNAMTASFVTGNYDVNVIHSDNGVLTLGTSSGYKLNLTSTTAQVSTSGDSSFADDITIITNHFVNQNRLISSSGDISIKSLAASALTLDGGSGGAFSAENGTIKVTAAAGVLTLSGKTTYETTARLIASEQGQSINLLNGSESIALAPSFLFTGTLSGNGTLTTVAPAPNPTWSIINQGSFVNSGGDISLSGNLNFSNLAIVASHNIDLTGAVINLSGGSLTLIAGFRCSLSTSGNTVFDSSTILHSFTPTSGGSILGSATINTSNSLGSGGNVLALANNGSIVLGSINTGGTVNGGGVTLLASSIQTGAISTIGDSGFSGAVRIETVNPTLPSGNGFQIQDGKVITGAGSVGIGTIAVGRTISVTSVDAGNSSANISAQEGTVILQSITAKDINLSAQELTLGVGTVAAGVDESGNAGRLSITASRINTPGNHLILEAVGQDDGNSGVIDFTSGAPSIVFSQAGDVEFHVGSLGGGNGGSVNVNAQNIVIGENAVSGATTKGSSSVSFSAYSNLTLNSSAFDIHGADGHGAHIGLKVVQANGTLTLNDTTFIDLANGTGSDGDGGAISLDAANIAFANSQQSPLALTALGSGTGNGGSISFVTRSPSKMYVGTVDGKPSKTAGTYITLDASSGVGGGNGGSLNVQTGGTLSVNMSGANAAARSSSGNWNGASYTFVSGRTSTSKGSPLLITGNVDASGVNSGHAGSIVLSSASTTAFSINAPKTTQNGVSGYVRAFDTVDTTGIISITNELGGVLLGQPAAIGTSGTLNISAGGRGSITQTSAKSNPVSPLPSVYAQANRMNLNTQTGSIGGNVPLSIAASYVSATSQGSVNITDGINAVVVLEDSQAVKGFTFNRTSQLAQDTILNNISCYDGSILVRTNGAKLSVTDSKIISASDGAVALINTGASTSDQIIIGSDAIVRTTGRGKQVSIIVGTNFVPKVGTNPYPTNIAPSGVIASATPRNVIYFGNPGVVTVPIGTATVNAKNVNVLFSGTSAGQIKLGNGAFIEADPPSSAGSQSVSGLMPTLESGTTTNLSISSSPAVEGIPFVNKSSLQYPSQFQNVSLLTASSLSSMVANTLSLQSGLTRSDIGMYSGDSVDDDSYVVGSCNTSNEIDAAVRSDAIVLSSGEIFGGSISQSSRYASSELTETLSSKDGPVLFVPTKDTAIETPFGIVKISGNSIALVSVSSAGLSVFDLDDQHKGSVSVESNGHNVVLSPGRHVLITPHHRAEFAQLNPIETIAHRALSSSVKNGHRAHMSEFSVLSAIDSVKPLKALAASSHPNARKISGRMLKTTAILMQLGGAREQYQHYFRPHMTAMQK